MGAPRLDGRWRPVLAPPTSPQGVSCVCYCTALLIFLRTGLTHALSVRMNGVGEVEVPVSSPAPAVALSALTITSIKLQRCGCVCECGNAYGDKSNATHTHTSLLQWQPKPQLGFIWWGRGGTHHITHVVLRFLPLPFPPPCTTTGCRVHHRRILTIALSSVIQPTLSSDST